MNIYDKAHELAREISSSDEYRKYKELKDELYQNEASRSLIKQYKKLQFEAQAQIMSGSQPGSETMDKLKKLGDVLQFNPKASEFFIAEYKLNTMISDIYKIIGDACDIDVDFMKE